MSNRDILNYKRAIFELNRARQSGNNVGFQDVIKEQTAVADEQSVGRGLKSLGQERGTSSPDDSSETSVPAPEQPVSPPAVSSSRSAQQLYRQILGNIAEKIGTVANPNDPNTVLGLLRSGGAAEATSAAAPSPTPAPPTAATTTGDTTGTPDAAPIAVPVPAMGTAPEAPTSAPGATQPPFQTIPAPSGQTRIGRLVRDQTEDRNGRPITNATWEIEVRLLEQTTPAPEGTISNGQALANYSDTTIQALQAGFNSVFGQWGPPEITLNSSAYAFNVTYQINGMTGATVPGSGVEQRLHDLLRQALSTANNILIREPSMANLRFVIPGDRGFDRAVPQPGSVAPSFGTQAGRAIGGALGAVGDFARELFEEQRLMKLAGIISEQAAPARVNQIIDQVIASAQRLAPEVRRVGTLSAYASQRQLFSNLENFLTGDFINQLNQVKSITDPQQKLAAMLRVYTPNNRGTLVRYLYPLGRLAATERRR